ncbi:hypothetical protein VB776_20275 [Arcicella sp. DC2W]|uniref:Uncharacterized protein n=1 Tax=Arcicella gelida TaxID=2984195 RepID=A0ABU5SA42_9BACT|nr:hypothetical protein [Arcicella sp. DC2W]MEA5405285.1 hypothetical protein [Arcicella sp. DC2W]
MVKLFVTQSRNYDERMDDLSLIPIDEDPDLGGRTFSGEELAIMITEFSNEIIANAFKYKAYLFDKDSIKRLTDQPGYEGLSIYFVKYLGRISVALFAVDIKNNPIVYKRQRKIDEQIIIEEGIWGEEDGTGHPPSKIYELLKTLQPDK